MACFLSNGGLGVVYWEPAWVSTKCSTRWGQGSHWENATFFDFHNNNEVHKGIEFLSYDYKYPQQLVDGEIDESYGDPLLEDAVGDNLEQVAHLDLLRLYAMDDENTISIGLVIDGDIFAEPWGAYSVYIDTTEDEQGADVDVGKRPISVADPYKPEFRLDISLIERAGTVSGSYVLNAWDGLEWQTVAFTGGAGMKYDTHSIIEIQILKATLGNPAFVNLRVVTTGRGRVHTAGDVLGTSVSPTDWNEPVTLETYVKYVISN